MAEAVREAQGDTGYITGEQRLDWGGFQCCLDWEWELEAARLFRLVHQQLIYTLPFQKS